MFKYSLEINKNANLTAEQDIKEYTDRFGKEPDHFLAVIGRIAVNFSELEDSVSSAISYYLKGGESVGRIVTSESSFKGKINLLSSLLRNLSSEEEYLERFDENIKLCLWVEEKRNQIMHSTWTYDRYSQGKIRRRKFTAKLKKGLKEQSEEVSLDELCQIADWIATAVAELDESMECEHDDYVALS